MLVISMSRKPLDCGSVAQNVLKHGCGAIHIGACRIQTTDSFGGGRKMSSSGNTLSKFGGYEQDGWVPSSSIGRWPANLILSHLAGCEENCQPGCPISVMDSQSGMVKGTVRNPTGRPIYPTDGHSMGWNPNRVMDKTVRGFADNGGASRYFKNTRRTDMEAIPEDLLSYLHTLITPTHVGGESLIALDLGAIDWKDIPDGKYHGLIARGEPTAEQVEHMWRVVKPGAHVLLIAPEECPTGHRGACTLEDKGFEIRDSILWVDKAGDGDLLHYVPKANSRERNAGTAHIAAKRKGPPLYELKGEADEEEVEALLEALAEAGVEEDIIENFQEVGIPKDKIPKEYTQLFKKVEGADKYGNFHPCVKPKEVMKALLRDVPEDATVIDPFMGSGSTGLACLDTGHNFIGIEREAEYIEIADARIRYWDRAQAGWVHTEIVSEAPQDAKQVTATAKDGDALDLFGGDE